MYRHRHKKSNAKYEKRYAFWNVKHLIKKIVNQSRELTMKFKVEI